jgi:aldehyde dehydrogenase (NAD+)
MGPVANKPQYEKVLGYLSTASQRVLRWHAVAVHAEEFGGLFVKPTLLTNVDPSHTVVREEVFGPVVAALTFQHRGRSAQAAPTTPRTGWPERSGRKTCTAPTGSPPSCGPARSG